MNELNRLADLESKAGELLSLAKVTIGVLDQDNQRALEDTLARRRRVAQKIKKLTRKLNPCFSSWDSFLAGLSDAQAAQAQRAADNTAAWGREVVDLDKQARSIMEKQLGELGSKLDKVATGRKLVAAYRPLPSGPSLPRHLSRKG